MNLKISVNILYWCKILLIQVLLVCSTIHANGRQHFNVEHEVFVAFQKITSGSRSAIVPLAPFQLKSNEILAAIVPLRYSVLRLGFVLKPTETKVLWLYNHMYIFVSGGFLIIGLALYILYINRRLKKSIQQNKQTTRALAESEMLWKTIVKTSPDGIIITSLAGEIQEASDKIRSIFAFDSNAELIGVNIYDLIDPEYHASTIEGIVGVLESKTQVIIEIMAIEKNGSRILIESNITTLNNSTSEPVSLIHIIRDITERKQIEEEIRQSRERFQTIFEQSPMGIALIDSFTGQILELNQKFAQISGRSMDEITGVNWMSITHPDDLQQAMDHMQKLNAGAISGFLMNKRYMLKNGGIVWIKLLVAPLKADHNSNSVHLCMIEDITEHKRIEAEINILHDELENRVKERTSELLAANQELETFSYTASHDLRTPLRALDGFANILLQDYSQALDDEGKRLLHVIITNANKMGRLIDELLSFSQIGRQIMQNIEIDMQDIVNKAYHELNPEIGNEKTEFHLEQLPKSIGDPVMIRQAWLNLIANAIKFSSRKSIAVIKIGSFAQDNEIVYYITDNGVGFNMEYSGKLFAVFQRLHSPKEFEGTGIGLAIVQRIIHRHKGRIWAKGKVGEGATFYFTIGIRGKSIPDES